METSTADFVLQNLEFSLAVNSHLNTYQDIQQ